MRSPICDLLGIEFPLVGFNHCRDVIVEISKAGGMGVLGAAGMTPEQLDFEMSWIDERIGGKPYGVDLIVPTSMAQQDDTTRDVKDVVPAEHRDFAAGILARHNIDTSDLYQQKVGKSNAFLDDSKATDLLEVVFSHPVSLVANALGVPPRRMLEMGKERGVAVAALVGAKEHAVKQAEAGVDILVVAGGEAGGHCGEVSTLVLVPEVVEAVKPYGEIPILAAGGIITGRQLAACMAMGAHGAWTGSMWLTTTEAFTSQVIKEKFLLANSRQTVRSKSRTGKFSRQLRSPWTDAWESDDAPDTLPMPLQGLVSEPALTQITKLAEGGHEGARQLATYWVGQGVGLMNEIQTTRQVVFDFMEDFLEATERLKGVMGEE
ncbi:MAG: nitronate monooxygenase family protein [Proteobacteria bacterium]|jgi:NAD(P)H-dependent flavin oxidoreductase YrpB (nitropropane dioxygenase family)|nr:nitronate monooxygenase family protein [Pseudomonadota bacterium]MDA1302075.1 nitronate monooxygenase family protein [Pseudomonadota bacterium]